jgi:coenzyme F420-0:L-glutamate ligase/coenzyme F420-1:gamma-L-glutamate ligase
VSGIAMGFYGFKPLKDMRKQEDLFGRKLIFTQINILDSLTGMAVLLMGEGREGKPLVLLRGYKDVEFTTKFKGKDFFIEPKYDIYGELLKKFRKS